METTREIPPSNDCVWVLDPTPSGQQWVREAIGEQTKLRLFSRLNDAITALDGETDRDQLPAFLISETHLPDGELVDALAAGFFTDELMVLTECRDPTVIERCLDLGARDYLLKPADVNLFRAKVRQQLRLLKLRQPAGLITGLELDTFGLTIREGGDKSISLTLKEFQILSILHRSLPGGMDREGISREIWGEVKVVHKTFDVHLFKLRRKLEELGYEVEYGKDLRYVLKKSGAP